MVHAGVFRNVAIDGMNPCSSSGVSTIPNQNIAWVCAPCSWETTRQLRIKLSSKWIKPREPGLPELHPVEFTGPRPPGVVIRQHKSREQDEKLTEHIRH